LVTTVEASAYRASRGSQNVHKIALRRTDSPTGGNFLLRTDQREVIAFAQERLESQQPVFVLYDPVRPKHAILPETL
jgi:hypothetical protein